MDTPTADIDSIDQINSGKRTPVVFVHGLWLLPTSWDRWAELFSHEGFAPLAPGWPDDPAVISARRPAALGLPVSQHRAVALTYEQFRYAFADVLDEDEARSSTSSGKS